MRISYFYRCQKNIQILPYGELDMTTELVWGSTTTKFYRSEFRGKYKIIKIPGVTISNEVDFRANKITRDKENHSVMVKDNSPDRHVSPKSIHTKPQSLKDHEAKTDGTERRNSQIHSLVRTSTTPLPPESDSISGQKISKDIEDLNNPINQQYLNDLTRTLGHQEQRTQFCS